MEKASRKPWTQHEHSPSAMQLREHTLKEFGEIFGDNRPFGTESADREANVQSKAVLSHAMTLMDKIRGWEDEESSFGSKFAACMWICTKGGLTGGQMLDRVQEQYLWIRTMSIMLCTSWVCVGAFVKRGWVTSRTISNRRKRF